MFCGISSTSLPLPLSLSPSLPLSLFPSLLLFLSPSFPPSLSSSPPPNLLPSHYPFFLPKIKSVSFLEDINNALNLGDVPNICPLKDLDNNIFAEMKPVVLDAGLQSTETNLFSAYTKRVRSNIHMVICKRCVCVCVCAAVCVCVCLSVYQSNIPRFLLTSPVQANICVDIHQSVAEKSKQF